MFFPTGKVECVGSLLISTKHLEEFGAWKPKVNLAKRATEPGEPMISPGDAMCHDSQGIAKLQRVLTESLEREKVSNLRKSITEKLERAKLRASEPGEAMISPGDAMCHDSEGVAKLQRVLTESLERENIANVRRSLTEKMERAKHRASQPGEPMISPGDAMCHDSQGAAKLQRVLTEKLEREKVANIRRSITEKLERRGSKHSGQQREQPLMTRDDGMAKSRGVAKLQKVLTETLAPRSTKDRRDRAGKLEQRAHEVNEQNLVSNSDPMMQQASGIAKLQKVLTETLAPRPKRKE